MTLKAFSNRCKELQTLFNFVIFFFRSGHGREFVQIGFLFFLQKYGTIRWVWTWKYDTIVWINIQKKRFMVKLQGITYHQVVSII